MGGRRNLKPSRTTAWLCRRCILAFTAARARCVCVLYKKKKKTPAITNDRRLRDDNRHLIRYRQSDEAAKNRLYSFEIMQTAFGGQHSLFANPAFTCF